MSLKRFSCAMVTALVALFSSEALAQAQAAYPNWWIYRGVVASQPPSAPGQAGYDPTAYDTWMADNYKLATIGQAKNLAKAARDTMEFGETGSAGAQINTLINNFVLKSPMNAASLNLGQLKAIAKPFYDVMHAAGVPVILADGTQLTNGQYPWNQSTPAPENYKAANLGQLKHVFSFELSTWRPDTDGDGISNIKETQLGLSPTNPDTDGDGLWDGYEWINQLDPFTDDRLGDSDQDLILNNQDSRPDDAAHGLLTVTINTPGNGVVIN